MDKNFRFDKETHRYFLDNEEIPSITKVIAPLNDFENVHPDVLQAKAQAGTNIHETVRLWLDRTLDEAALAEGNRIALDLFLEWHKNESGFLGALLEYENPTYHEKLKYGGTPDLVFETAIVDIKTSFSKSMELKYSVQLAGYEKLFPDFPPKDLYVLHLDIVNKKYKMWNLRKKQSWSMFRFLLDYYRAGEKIRSWRSL